MDVLLEISRLLNTGLDMESLSICVRLCEQGINPEALSAVIKELRKASETLKGRKPCSWICSYNRLSSHSDLSVSWPSVLLTKYERHTDTAQWLSLIAREPEQPLASVGGELQEMLMERWRVD
ncbi:hypothetical protein NQZ68_003100 [Dissostichus eleginoides]|nr:hypothetical protein NQZ68_003100 [Dissostichus eleginoides]